MANPRSGSQKAGRFIRDYGEQTNVLSIGDDTTCTVRVYNVITQKKEYSESIENVLMSKVPSGILEIYYSFRSHLGLRDHHCSNGRRRLYRAIR